MNPRLTAALLALYAGIGGLGVGIVLGVFAVMVATHVCGWNP